MLGRPLLAFTVEAAIGSDLFSRVVVSTDDEEIAEVAVRHGAEVPFLRSADLADDHVPVSAATADTLRRLDPAGDVIAAVCQLMPNCPLRTAEDIVASHRQFAETGADSQLSVSRFGWQNPWWAMRRDETFGLTPLFAQRLSERSQDLEQLYCPTGAVWWAKAEVLRHTDTFYIPERTGWEIAWTHAVDIDDEHDWLLAEALMEISRRS